MEEFFELEGGGRLAVREDGAQVRFSAQRRTDGAGLYKVWVRGAGGEMLLGTLAPEGPRLRLERAMSRDSLERAGCWPVTGGRTVLAFSFAPQGKAERPGWRWEQRPGRRLRDPVLRECADGWGPMLVREDGQGFWLAAPLDVSRPFPMAALFCLGHVVRVDGQTHVAFRFDSRGEPSAERSAPEP